MAGNSPLQMGKGVDQNLTKISFKLSGTDECWPTGSRCPADQFCVDDELGYHCQEEESLEAVLDSAWLFLEEIKDSFVCVSIF